jgi:excisionase family DNA binding protein
MEEQAGNGWISVREAASHLGISDKTVRKKIKSGELESRQVETRFGLAYQVRVEGFPGLDSRVEAGVTPTNLELLKLVRELQAKAETAAMWQGRCEVLSLQLAQSQERVKALEAPKTGVGVEENRGEVKPWWKFFLRYLTFARD